MPWTDGAQNCADVTTVGCRIYLSSVSCVAFYLLPVCFVLTPSYAVRLFQHRNSRTTLLMRILHARKLRLHHPVPSMEKGMLRTETEPWFAARSLTLSRLCLQTLRLASTQKERRSLPTFVAAATACVPRNVSVLVAQIWIVSTLKGRIRKRVRTLRNASSRKWPFH
jgi:hypothetical protein